MTDPRLRALADTPLFMLPTAAHALFEASARADWNSGTETGGEAKPYEIGDGIATLPIRGGLANRREDGWWDTTTYEGFRDTLSACLADPACSAILLDIDSPGGTAAGAMETAEAIRAASAQKPVIAFVDGMACSAAYALASGASRVVCAPSAMLGSIGVVMLHFDVSKMLENYGVKPTLLFSGAYKTDGFPTKPLDKGSTGRLQQMLDDHYGHFVATVGKHRPDLGVDGARKTEAGLFVGPRAVSSGLADMMGDMKTARMVATGEVRARAEPDGPMAKAHFSLFARSAVRSASKMAVKLYRAGEKHANSLIDDGKVDKDSDWSFSAEDGDALLGKDGDDWDNYASFHLGEDPDADEKTKARFKYPFGKDGKVFRSALTAIRSRASQQDADEVYEAAGRLLEKIDRNEKEAKVAEQQALEAAKAEGISAERARVSAILGHAEAVGRQKLAEHMAFNTAIAPADAAALLAAAPKEAAAVAGSRLDGRVPVAVVKADGGAGDEPANDYERGRAAFAAVLKKPQSAA
jgi:signal peptide peptidase SppA